MTSLITHERLLQVVAYCQGTGHFSWKQKTCKKAVVGKRIGFPHAGGYVRVRIDKGDYLAHRLAWFYVTGKWPSNNIDHIDGTKTNNAFHNLRDVSQAINLQNQRVARSTSKVGLLGVRKHRKRFEARIMVDGKEISLGGYPTKELAHEAYLTAKRQFHVGCTI